ncbi:MAG: hypothetical protein ACYDAE_00890 [Steroidobacteraceae bacterium]
MAGSTVVVKRFLIEFPGGGSSHYSIRRRADGLFQVYHDDPYRGINQPYEFEDKAISGLFADASAAEAELMRLEPRVEPEP